MHRISRYRLAGAMVLPAALLMWTAGGGAAAPAHHGSGGSWHGSKGAIFTAAPECGRPWPCVRYPP